MADTLTASKDRVGGFLKGDDSSVVNPSNYWLYDKIINVQFVSVDHKHDFTIRSDYELERDADGHIRFKRCSIKPKIYFEMMRYADTSISIKLKITNLNYSVAGSIKNKFSDKTRPEKCIIFLGYRGQFINWTQPPFNADQKGEDGLTEKALLAKFYNIDSTYEASSDQDRTPQKIRFNISAIYEESSSPDRVTVFEGFVGTNSLEAQTVNFALDETSFKQAMKDAQQNGEYGSSALDKFLNVSLGTRFISDEYTTKYDADDKCVKVKWWNSDEHRFYTSDEIADFGDEVKWGKVEGLADEDAGGAGFMTNRDDFIMLGLHFRTSDNARKDFKKSYEAMDDNTLKSFLKEFQKYRSPIKAFNFIRDTICSSLRMIAFWDGDFLIISRHDNEATISDFINWGTEDGAFSADSYKNPILLPAVYSITDSPLGQIKCPFISFIKPGQCVGFASKYFMGDLVSYYLPTTYDAFFRVISVATKFETVGNTNEMTLVGNFIYGTQKKVLKETVNNGGSATDSEALISLKSKLFYRAKHFEARSYNASIGNKLAVKRVGTDEERIIKGNKCFLDWIWLTFRTPGLSLIATDFRDVEPSKSKRITNKMDKFETANINGEEVAAQLVGGQWTKFDPYWVYDTKEANHDDHVSLLDKFLDVEVYSNNNFRRTLLQIINGDETSYNMINIAGQNEPEYQKKAMGVTFYTKLAEFLFIDQNSDFGKLNYKTFFDSSSTSEKLIIKSDMGRALLDSEGGTYTEKIAKNLKLYYQKTIDGKSVYVTGMIAPSKTVTVWLPTTLTIDYEYEETA